MRTNRTIASSFTMWSILLFMGSIAMGAGVFAVTQAAKQHESGIEEINKSILAERQSIRVLEAEWAYLSRPQRLEELMALREARGEMPPVPAPIATVSEDASAAQAEQPVEAKTASAAGMQDIVKTKPESEVAAAAVKEKPRMQIVKAEPAKAPKVAKASASAPAKTVSYDGAWSPKKKKIISHAAKRPVPMYQNIASRGGMRPIVE